MKFIFEMYKLILDVDSCSFLPYLCPPQKYLANQYGWVIGTIEPDPDSLFLYFT